MWLVQKFGSGLGDDHVFLNADVAVALAISLIGFMESISVAKSLASKRREKIDANQELVALGIANLEASFSSGYPVTGSFSRSAVSFAAGANTGLASIITVGLVALTVIFLTPLFNFLPKAVLATIIIVAASGLVDIQTLKHTWQYNKADAAELIVTFTAVLAVDIEIGLPIGIVAPILLFLWRTNRPHAAIVGRLGDSEIYRNILYHEVKICPHVVAIRIDESLYFANTKFLEDTILGLVADRSEVKHLVLICSAINFINTSALGTLESLIEELHDAEVAFYLTAVKDQVLDRLKAIGFVDRLGPDHIYMSTHDLMVELDCV